LSGCNYTGGSKNDSQTGGIAVHIIWPEEKTTETIQQPHFATMPASVTTVSCTVTASDMNTVTASFNASAGSGTITGVPVGSNRTLVMEGLDASGVAQYRAVVRNISVTSGSTADAGTAIMAVVSNFKSTISMGGNHACDVYNSSVRCWGANYSGQLGDGSYNSRSFPSAVNGISTAVQVSAGAYHSCAVLSEGTIQCWGDNYDGQLGDGSTTYSYSPVEVVGISTAVQVSAGGYHTCTVVADGSVWCWGVNYSGQLGNGTTDSSSVPMLVSGISNAVQVSVGEQHSCALKSDGAISCWGAGWWGQLGDGYFDMRTTPVSVSGIATAVQVSAGYYHTCAVLSDGTLKCWGENEAGRLGNGDTSISAIPVFVSGITTAEQVSAGYNSTCAVTAFSEVWCWGASIVVGYGDSWTPQQVDNLYADPKLSVGGGPACVVTTDDVLKCWGANYDGELGNGTYDNADTPVAVLEPLGAGTIGVGALAAGWWYTCVAMEDFSMKCWGSNVEGQLGTGDWDFRYNSTVVSGITLDSADEAQISAGGYHTCAIVEGDPLPDKVNCWGLGSEGQLGDGVWSSQVYPVEVSGLTTATQVSIGANHSCALLSDNSVQCWGRGFEGQIGNGANADQNTPVAVTGLTTATQISSNGGTSCALLAAGTVNCWGQGGNGQLGNTVSFDSNVIVSVNGLGNTATQVVVGEFHVCALLSDNRVQCWGGGTFGELGNGTNSDANVAGAFVTGLNTAIQVSAGSEFSCAVLSDGTIQCWGEGARGKLGNGTTNDTNVPSTVSEITTAVQVSCGYDHACALLSDYSVKCWGAYDSLGFGSDRLDPTDVY